ncbi:MAG: hypothetical protein KAI81_09060 [Candidatus Marinimicrobia bacterium]|nr:hypothetical protein [Candidatus Neomarinimicrobiota bacterium]
MIKKFNSVFFVIIIFFACADSLSAQMRSEYFDAFYGGGIGYTPGIFIMPEIELPVSAESPDFSGPRYAHGVQGWGTITKKWRIGASVIASINEQNFDVAGSDTIVYTRFSMSASYLFAEYVFGLSKKTQLAFNLGVGVSNLSIRYLKNPNDRNWDDLFVDPGLGTHLTVKGAATALPMVSWIWQFMHRGGLRINAGAAVTSVPQSSWKIDDFYSVSNASNGVNQLLVAPAFQMYVYFGL